MKQMMKRLGITTEEIENVEKVIIRTADKDYVITGAEVTIMTVQGQKTYQITGETSVEARGEGDVPEDPFSDEDVEIVMGQAQVSESEAREALRETNGQPAEAIILLMSRK
jgi:nascent polypeptide-associated complex subunit alpha